MQLIQTTISTTRAELIELMQHITLHNIEGQVNITFEPDGVINVWQPSKLPAPDDINQPLHPYDFSNVIEKH